MWQCRWRCGGGDDGGNGGNGGWFNFAMSKLTHHCECGVAVEFRLEWN